METKMIVLTAHLNWEASSVSQRDATAADYAAFHPKCGTCVYCDPYDQSEEGECGNEFSYSSMQEVNLFTDYCPQHSELERVKKETS